MKKLEPAHGHKLPVWVKGNVYFNGAKAYKKETNNLVDTEHSVTVDLNMEDGCPVLATNLYEFLGDFADSMVNSDILGYAFEAGKSGLKIRTEQTLCLTAITLETTEASVSFPGPFANAEDAGKKLFS